MSQTEVRFHDEPLLTLPPDLVIGSIIWRKALGVPEGGVRNAFQIHCYTYKRQSLGPVENPSGVRFLVSPHPVDAWEGPDDDAFHRVSFRTSSRAPQGFGDDSHDPRSRENYLDLSFRDGVVWKASPLVRAGVKTFRPAQSVFFAVNHAQVLPDIEVINLTPFLHR